MKDKIDSLINENIKALNPKQPLPKAENAIYLNKGELPYPPSPEVVKAIANAATTVNRYPDVLGGDLRKVLAEYTDKKVEQIIIGNGSDDLIELIIKVFVKPGEEVLLPIPTFFVYGLATQIIGGVPVFVNRNENFDLDIEAIIEKVTSKTKILFIANPNNPTAKITAKDTIVEILDRVNCLVVVDECYYEFSRKTVADLLEKYPNLIILRSLSKNFGLAGLRVGYGIASETIIDYCYRAAQLFPVNKLALIAGEIALQNLEYVREKIAEIDREKSNLTKELEKLGFIVCPSAANFLFVRTKPLGITSKDLVEVLANKNIFVADFGLKQGLDAYYFRTSVGTPQENQALLKALNQSLD